MASHALSIAAELAVRSKFELTNRFAGPSEPGRGSIGNAKAGLPTKLPWASGIVLVSAAALKPLPRLFVAVTSDVVLSSEPLPWNRLFLSVTMFGLAEKMAKPLRALVWSWFCQKMLLATYAWVGVAAVLIRFRPMVLKTKSSLMIWTGAVVAAVAPASLIGDAGVRCRR